MTRLDGIASLIGWQGLLPYPAMDAVPLFFLVLLIVMSTAAGLFGLYVLYRLKG